MTRCPIDDYYDEAGWWLDTAGEFDARLPDYNGFCFGDLWVTRCGWAEGDPEVGRDIAQEHCVRCHDVSPAGEFKTYPPSFASIAVYRDVDQIRSRIAFPQLHSAMPQMIYLLDTDDVADLVAYITSLEAEPE